LSRVHTAACAAVHNTPLIDPLLCADHPAQQPDDRQSLTVKGSLARWRCYEKISENKAQPPGTFMDFLNDDIRNERGRQPITVTLLDFDQKVLLNDIECIRGNIPRYQLARNNCSHIVAECLYMASDKNPSLFQVQQLMVGLVKFWGVEYGHQTKCLSMREN
jgi:hypothetical protein